MSDIGLRKCLTKMCDLKCIGKIVAMVVFCLLTTAGKSQTFSVNSNEKMEKVTDVWYTEDSEGILTYEFLDHETGNANWRPLNEDFTPDFDIEVYWLKFDLTNPTEDDLDLVLDFDRWDFINVFFDYGTGSTVELKTGEAMIFANRNIQNGNGRKVKFGLETGQSVSVMCRLYHSPNVGLPAYSFDVECGTDQASQKEEFLLESINMIVIAILSLIFIYNLFFFVATKERRYRFYLIHMVLVSLEFARRAGYFNGLWGEMPAGPEIDHQLFLVLNFLSIVLVLLLFADYLDTRKFIPRWHKYILGLIIPTTVLYFLGMWDFTLTLDMTGYALVGTTVFFFYLNWLVIKKGHPVANYFLPGLVFFAVGNIIQAFSQAGILEMGELGEVLARSIGMVISDAILSYGLGRRVFLLKEENERKGRLVIKTLKEQQAIQLMMGREVLNSQESVRRGIAARLHDDIQNILVSIRFNLMAFRPRIEKNAHEKPAEIDGVVAQLKSAIQIVRQISHDLMPTSLSDPLGLDVSLENYLISESGNGDLNYHYPDPRPLPDAIRTLAYRIVQEIVNPGGRTSNTGRLDLSITNDEDSLNIRVEDFRSHTDKNVAEPEKRLNLSYFLSLFGGTIDTRLMPEDAIETKISIPLNQSTIAEEVES